MKFSIIFIFLILASLTFSIPQAKAPKGIECTVCEWIMEQVEAFISENTTEQEIEQFLENVCNMLPSPINTICDGLIEQYIPVIVQLLVNDFPPDQICTEIGLCTSMKAPKGIECTVCEWIMEQVEAFISENTTEQEIEQFLENVCNMLPSPINTICDGLIEQYIPVIVQLLVNDFPPDQICTEIGLCTSMKAPKGIECTVCEWIMEQVEAFISENTTEQEIEQFLENVCNMLPSPINTICDGLIEQYIPVIVQLLVNDFPPDQICTEIGLCTSMKAPKGIECTVCEWIMEQVEAFISENTTEQEIEQFLENVCNMLPSPINTICDGLIEQYIPVIVQLLVNDFPPDQICTEIGLCTSMKAPKGIECTVCEWIMEQVEAFISENTTEQEIEQFLENVCNMLPSPINTICDGLIEQYIPVIVQLLVNDFPPDQICTEIGLCTSMKAPKGIECTVCEWIMEQVEAFISENTTEQEIEQFLENVCNMLPSPINTICDGLIEQYIPVIVQLLVNDFPPDQICTEIGLCTSMKAPKGIECTVCEWIMEQVEAFISENTTEQEIEQFLENVCNMLPSPINTICDGLIEQYIPVIVQLLVNDFPPDQICTEIGLCTSMKAPKGIECTVCEWIMEQVEAFISENTTEQEIEQFLENVCNMLPSPINTICDGLIEQYIPVIVQLLVNDFPPDQICTEIGLCTSMKAPKGIECTVCEWIMEQVEAFISENTTEQEIEQFLENVCNMLPSPINTICDGLIEQYIPVIVQLLVNDFPPDQICTEIGLCTSMKAPKGIECTVCEWIMEQVEAFISENTTEQEIEQFLENVCNMLPSPINTICDGLIEQYIPVIVQLLVNDFPPDQICTEIGLCTSMKVGGDDKCIICDLVMKYLEEFIDDPTDEAEVEKFLNEVCSKFIPDPYKTDCDTLIDTFYETIVKLLVSDFPPDKVCEAVGLCP
ncbi:hypothetical protein M0811_10565 [Anaeramoeba ignava]|uniref:Saposin B-type domain-containing protein n=1 Tax=Anaeramoeba ignava TaxID=1746090 RepID=A0A9Q0R8T6_ANAIG|nr:hypothetical protein M0811_10565 [Anaeramoeba ignava]